jgi:DNA-binding LacI/PurR family transcriptional regulator
VGADARPPPGGVTLEQVGALAGVSRATVSRVINNSPKVSPGVRSAVERAIAQLGYAPNPAARALVTRRANMAALVVAEPESRVFGEPFFPLLVRGLTRRLSEAGMQLLLLLPAGAEQIADAERYLRQGHTDGVVLTSLHADNPLAMRLARSGPPIVVCGRPPADAPVAYADVDNAGGAAAAVGWLLGHGRRRVATVAGPADMAAGVDRLEGWRAAHRAAGLPVDTGLVAAGDFSLEGGVRATEALLARCPDLDAIFAASDLMALGALRALRAAGRRVPADVAVIGFDDAPLAASADPALSTVRQPAESLGREAARLLLASLATPDTIPPPVILPTELILRAST